MNKKFSNNIKYWGWNVIVSYIILITILLFASLFNMIDDYKELFLFLSVINLAIFIIVLLLRKERNGIDAKIIDNAVSIENKMESIQTEYYKIKSDFEKYKKSALFTHYDEFLDAFANIDYVCKNFNKEKDTAENLSRFIYIQIDRALYANNCIFIDYSDDTKNYFEIEYSSAIVKPQIIKRAIKQDDNIFRGYIRLPK